VDGTLHRSWPRRDVGTACDHGCHADEGSYGEEQKHNALHGARVLPKGTIR
jgi:hypothetical protein